MFILLRCLTSRLYLFFLTSSNDVVLGLFAASGTVSLFFSWFIMAKICCFLSFERVMWHFKVKLCLPGTQICELLFYSPWALQYAWYVQIFTLRRISFKLKTVPYLDKSKFWDISRAREESDLTHQESSGLLSAQTSKVRICDGMGVH